MCNCLKLYVLCVCVCLCIRLHVCMYLPDIFTYTYCYVHTSIHPHVNCAKVCSSVSDAMIKKRLAALSETMKWSLNTYLAAKIIFLNFRIKNTYKRSMWMQILFAKKILILKIKITNRFTKYLRSFAKSSQQIIVCFDKSHTQTYVCMYVYVRTHVCIYVCLDLCSCLTSAVQCYTYDSQVNCI